MTTKNETFNGLREYPIRGRYFELLTTEAPVDLKFFDRDGNVIADDQDMEAGYWVDRRGLPEVAAFERFEITTSSNQAVKFIVTDGLSGTKRASTSTTLTDRAGTHTLDGVAITNVDALIVAANAARKYLQIQNQDAANDLFITTDGSAATADAEAVRIRPGETWAPLIPPVGAVRGIMSGASAGVNVNFIEA